LQPDGCDAPDHSTLITSDTVCLNCHTIPPALLEDFYLTPVLSNSVTTLITALNRWAANQTNSLLATNGVVAWEYTNPGGLTWRTNSAGNVTGWTLNNPVTFTADTVQFVSGLERRQFWRSQSDAGHQLVGRRPDLDGAGVAMNEFPPLTIA
jgi:hypothetical protein